MIGHGKQFGLGDRKHGDITVQRWGTVSEIGRCRRAFKAAE